LKGDTHEWWYAPEDGNCEEGIQVLNEYNKLIHIIIRNSGGNNAKRFILFTSCPASYGYVTSNWFQIPDDSQYNSSAKRIFSKCAYVYSIWFCNESWYKHNQF